MDPDHDQNANDDEMDHLFGVFDMPLDEDDDDVLEVPHGIPNEVAAPLMGQFGQNGPPHNPMQNMLQQLQQELLQAHQHQAHQHNANVQGAPHAQQVAAVVAGHPGAQGYHALVAGVWQQYHGPLGLGQPAGHAHGPHGMIVPAGAPMPAPIPAAAALHIATRKKRQKAAKPPPPTPPPVVPLDPSFQLNTAVGSYLMNEELADVHFLIPVSLDEPDKAKHRVPCHKFVLATRSEVFKAMFYGAIAERNDEITLPDVDIAAFKVLLRYCYTDKIELDATNVISTMYVSKKYCLAKLESACDNFMTNNLNASNVLQVLQQALLFNCELIDLCWLKVDEWTKDVIVSASFEELDHQLLLMLLKRDSLSVTEVDLYKAVVRWARAECGRKKLDETGPNLREVLGEALFLIRFPTVSGNDFAFVMENEFPGLLTEEERSKVFNSFAHQGDSNASPFPVKKRNALVQPITRVEKEACKEMVVSRFRMNDSGKLCTFDDCHKIDFTVSEPVYITGLGVYGTRCEDGERNVYVELLNGKTGEILAEGNFRVRCAGTVKIYQIRFKAAVLIRPHEIYTASAKFDNNYPYPTYYGVGGSRIVDVDNVKFLFFKTERENYLDTGGEKGQIPQILFRKGPEEPLDQLDF